MPRQKKYRILGSKVIANAQRYRAGKMDIQVEGPWNTEKYYGPPWLADNKNY